MLFACLLGCRQSTQLNTQRIELELPISWTVEVNTNFVSNEWWHSFAVPELGQWIQGVLSHNHDLKIAAIRVERADTEARMSTFASRPKLDVSV